MNEGELKKLLVANSALFDEDTHFEEKTNAVYFEEIDRVLDLAKKDFPTYDKATKEGIFEPGTHYFLILDWYQKWFGK